MDPCFASFPGLNISRADMVFSHGVTPSVCHVVARPQTTAITSGPLVFAQDGQPVVRFEDVALDRNWDSPPYVKRGQRMNLKLLDRRWRWKGQTISGRYNVRRNDALATTHTAKTYYELICLLLEALGESNYDVQIPYRDLDGPTVLWSCARADLELAWIVDSLGCLVVLGLDNRVYIVPNGIGPVYPPTGHERIPVVEFLPATSPWAARAEYGPTRFQSALLLEAVGLEDTGEVVPIDDLSYTPSGGWRLQVPGVYNDVSDDVERACARESVYRWYRIKAQSDGSISLPGGVYTISAITDILPISRQLILPPPYLGFDNRSITNDPPDQAFIEGYFFDGDLKGVNENNDEWSLWDDNFEMDEERGIVKFSEYMFRVAPDGHQEEAELYLTCSYQARANSWSAPYHWHQEVLTGSGRSEDSGVAQVRRPDLFQWVARGQTESAPGPVYSNTAAMTEHGTALADSYAQHWRGLPQFDQQWAGIRPYAVNGNLHQVRWVVGGDTPMTYGSKNSAVPHFGPSYAERRLREKVERNLV